MWRNRQTRTLQERIGAILWEFNSPHPHSNFHNINFIVSEESSQKAELLLLDSYLQTIKNGVGTGLFRNLYLKINGQKTDILENGRLSCAIFVSSILYLFKLISDLHATVSSTVRDMEKSGWLPIETPRLGAVLLWEKSEDSNDRRHLGFYIGDDQAISNSSKTGVPEIHHWTYGTKNEEPAKKIEKIFWHKKLN